MQCFSIKEEGTAHEQSPKSIDGKAEHDNEAAAFGCALECGITNRSRWSSLKAKSKNIHDSASSADHHRQRV